MSEYHELCQLRIDGLKDTIATLTAERDEANSVRQEGWDWVDDMCEAVGPGTTVFNFKERLIAAEKVCEAAERMARNQYMNGWEKVKAALTEWRRTKEDG